MVVGNLGGAGGGGTITNAITTPAQPQYGLANGTRIFQGWGNVTITVSSNPQAPWNTGYGTQTGQAPDIFGIQQQFGLGLMNDIYNAMTMLHELGHAFNIIMGAGGSQIVDDQGNPAASRANTQLIYERCFQNLAPPD